MPVTLFVGPSNSKNLQKLTVCLTRLETVGDHKVDRRDGAASHRDRFGLHLNGAGMRKYLRSTEESNLFPGGRC